MRSLPFKSVLHWVAGKMLGDPERMRDSEAAEFCRYINQYVRKGWERDNWPEWTYCEERLYRPVYSAETDYVAGDEVWSEADQVYATYAGYEALGDIVDLQGHSLLAFTIAGAISAPQVGGRIRKVGTTDVATITNVNTDTFPTGYLVTVSPELTLVEVGDSMEHTAAPLGAGWETATDLNRYISLDQEGETPIGTVVRMSPCSPDEYPGSPRFKFSLSSNGVQVPARAGDSVWLQFRTRPPTFTSEKYSASAAYAPNDLVYWLDTGECYKRTSATPGTITAVAPSDSAHWTRVPFPYVLADYVQRAAYAEALDSDGQPDKSARQADIAEEELALEWGKSEGQQDQVRSYAVATRAAPQRTNYHCQS